MSSTALSRDDQELLMIEKRLLEENLKFRQMEGMIDPAEQDSDSASSDDDNDIYRGSMAYKDLWDKRVEPVYDNTSNSYRGFEVNLLIEDLLNDNSSNNIDTTFNNKNNGDDNSINNNNQNVRNRNDIHQHQLHHERQTKEKIQVSNSTPRKEQSKNSETDLSKFGNKNNTTEDFKNRPMEGIYENSEEIYEKTALPLIQTGDQDQNSQPCLSANVERILKLKKSLSGERNLKAEGTSTPEITPSTTKTDPKMTLSSASTSTAASTSAPTIGTKLSLTTGTTSTSTTKVLSPPLSSTSAKKTSTTALSLKPYNNQNISVREDEAFLFAGLSNTKINNSSANMSVKSIKRKSGNRQQQQQQQTSFSITKSTNSSDVNSSSSEISSKATSPNSKMSSSNIKRKSSSNKRSSNGNRGTLTRSRAHTINHNSTYYSHKEVDTTENRDEDLLYKGLRNTSTKQNNTAESDKEGNHGGGKINRLNSIKRKISQKKSIRSSWSMPSLTGSPSPTPNNDESSSSVAPAGNDNTPSLAQGSTFYLKSLDFTDTENDNDNNVDDDEDDEDEKNREESNDRMKRSKTISCTLQLKTKKERMHKGNTTTTNNHSCTNHEKKFQEELKEKIKDRYEREGEIPPNNAKASQIEKPVIAPKPIRNLNKQQQQQQQLQPEKAEPPHQTQQPLQQLPKPQQPQQKTIQESLAGELDWYTSSNDPNGDLLFDISHDNSAMVKKKKKFGTLRRKPFQ